MSQVGSEKTSKYFSSSSRPDTSSLLYFKEVLKDARVTLVPQSSNILTQEQALVLRDINKTVTKHYNYPNNCEEFVTGLQSYCKDEETFKNLLLPTRLQKITDDDDDSDFGFVQQESVIRLLLNVSCLQNKVVMFLMEEATEKAMDATDTMWLRLLLSPFKYLSHINDSKDLSTRILELLEICTYEGQVEILMLMPDITPDNQHEDVAKGLSKLLGDKDELTGALIDCMNCLNVTADTREDIQDHILSILQSQTAVKTFPILLEFLVTDCKPDKLNGVLIKVRSALDMILDQIGSEDNQVMIFNRLQWFLMARRVISEGWMNIINKIRTSNDHKSIDVLILFMIHSKDQTKRKIVETMFRNRAKNGLFKTSLLVGTFAKIHISQMLKDCHKSMIKIASSLLQIGIVLEPKRIDFGSNLYKQLFIHEHSDSFIRKAILSDLIFLTGAFRNSDPVLNTLTLLGEDAQIMLPHVLQLMGLLEQLDEMDLSGVKKVFNLLSSLIYSKDADDSLSSLQNELHMLIRKQLSSTKKIVKQRGIIAAISAVTYLIDYADDNETSTDLDDTTINLSDIPLGRARDAANLIELTNLSVNGCPELMCLYYDQLASIVVAAKHFEKYFIAWLSDTISNDFQNLFVTETIPQPMNDVPISMQFNLNSDEEIEAPVSVNIAELTLKANDDHSVLILSPIFRVLRLLHCRQHGGDLSTIDALLGCGIIMPVLHDDVIFDAAFDVERTKQVANCLFHCVNWFREVISAFVRQKRKHKIKVVRRLQDLIDTEELLESCMRTIPEHRLPASYVESTEKGNNGLFSKPEVPKKRAKMSSDVTTSIIDSSIMVSGSKTQLPTVKRKQKAGKKILPKEQAVIKYRDLDTDVILLIKYPLLIEDDTEHDLPTTSTSITLKQFKFLMKDFVSKLELITKSKNLGLSHLNVVKPESFINDCSHLMTYMNKHMFTITDRINNLLENNDGRHDLADMFTTEATELKLCFNYVLQIYALIFGWSGFQHQKNAALLRECLKSWRKDVQSQSQVTSLKLLITELTSRLFSYVEKCLTLPAAISVINVLKALYDLNNDPGTKVKLNTISGKFLTTKWYNLSGTADSGKLYMINIDVLVKSHLDGISLKNLSGLVNTLQTQAPKLVTKEDVLSLFASIDKSNFAILFRGICQALLNAVRSETSGSLTNEEHLMLWRTNAVTMQALTNIIKVHDHKTNMISYLKNSLGILKIFLSHGIPILEIMLKSETDRVVEILKMTQQSTRFLHHMCCYSKYKKDTSLVAFVPQFRLTLETLVYRVKAVLVANNCSAAFLLGALKNKDIRGEEILSQSTISSEQSSVVGSDEEELLENEESDEDLDLDVFGENSSSYGSASELY